MIPFQHTASASHCGITSTSNRNSNNSWSSTRTARSSSRLTRPFVVGWRWFSLGEATIPSTSIRVRPGRPKLEEAHTMKKKRSPVLRLAKRPKAAFQSSERYRRHCARIVRCFGMLPSVLRLAKRPKAAFQSSERSWHNGGDIEIGLYARSLHKAAKTLIATLDLEPNSKTAWDACPASLL